LVHFFAMALLGLFVGVHVTMVSVPRTFLAMWSGRAVRKCLRPATPEWLKPY
jgi:thiosulfate reductase cytochrome b subunit